MASEVSPYIPEIPDVRTSYPYGTYPFWVKELQSEQVCCWEAVRLQATLQRSQVDAKKSLGLSNGSVSRGLATLNMENLESIYTIEAGQA